MEDSRNKSNIFVILLLLLIFALGGFIIYDKIIRKEEVKNSTSNSEVLDSKDIKHLLSLVIVKRNSNDEIQSYKVSDLTDKDINDIIAACVVQDENYIEETTSTFRMKASEVNAIVKNLYGISNPNLTAGTDIYSVHNLALVDINNEKYYEAKRKSDVEVAVPNTDVFGYHNIRNVSYTKDGELIIECTVVKYELESPMYYLYGTATIKFNINNGIKFVSLDFKKEDVISSYTEAPIEV